MKVGQMCDKSGASKLKCCKSQSPDVQSTVCCKVTTQTSGNIKLVSYNCVLCQCMMTLSHTGLVFGFQ